MKKNSRFAALLLAIITILSIAAVPASAASSACKFNISNQQVQGNLSSYSLPAAQTPSPGQTFYINMSATTDYKFTRARFLVMAPGSSNYTCIYDYAPGGYFRWCYTPYTFSKIGTYSIKIILTKTNGTTISGESNVTVTAKANTPSGSNTMSWNGTQYKVVPNLSLDKCYNQLDYSRFVKNGKNVGCTATAMCTAYSLYHNTYLSPNSVYWNNGTAWEYAKVYVKCTTQTAALENAFQAVQSGLPVIIGVAGGKAGSSDHVVTVVGVRQGANYNALSLSDFICADPYGGGICRLDSYNRIDTGWSLRISA